MNDSSALLEFLGASPSPYHATENLAALFEARGFKRLQEADRWSLSVGEKYYYTRSGASFVAFQYANDQADRGVRVIGAHTDSPCLKVKPTPEMRKGGYLRLGIEVYGGALLTPWFDRDLSLAGKVTGINQSGDLCSFLVDFKKPIAVIPNLAIHLDRSANSDKTVNPQKDMNAIIDLADETRSFHELLLAQIKRQYDRADIERVLDFNMSFYDTQPPEIVGLNDAFITSARIDNLLSCFVGADSLAQSDGGETAILICNDHEEVGSRSEVGAQSTMLADLLHRLFPVEEERQRALRHSLMLSVDNAHGIHPNYADKHDANHGPLINAGPVIKFDADQGYATTSDSAAFVRWLAGQGKPLPLQSFVTRADMRCGSTIGPITSSIIGIKTVDIGVPQFAMHSIRELAGVEDARSLGALLRRFVAVSKIPF